MSEQSNSVKVVSTEITIRDPPFMVKYVTVNKLLLIQLSKPGYSCGFFPLSVPER